EEINLLVESRDKLYHKLPREKKSVESDKNYETKIPSIESKLEMTARLCVTSFALAVQILVRIRRCPRLP
ncbi:MAG: hypothetical protein ACTSUE_12455, partial [Promethearchaeota archaeon]